MGEDKTLEMEVEGVILAAVTDVAKANGLKNISLSTEYTKQLVALIQDRQTEAVLDFIEKVEREANSKPDQSRGRCFSRMARAVRHAHLQREGKS